MSFDYSLILLHCTEILFASESIWPLVGRAKLYLQVLTFRNEPWIFNLISAGEKLLAIIFNLKQVFGFEKTVTLFSRPDMQCSLFEIWCQVHYAREELNLVWEVLWQGRTAHRPCTRGSGGRGSCRSSCRCRSPALPPPALQSCGSPAWVRSWKFQRS